MVTHYTLRNLNIQRVKRFILQLNSKKRNKKETLLISKFINLQYSNIFIYFVSFTCNKLFQNFYSLKQVYVFTFSGLQNTDFEPFEGFAGQFFQCAQRRGVCEQSPAA